MLLLLLCRLFQLVRAQCELLLERLQQQSVLQVVLLVDAADLQLICKADEQQRQPGWWQQQVQLGAAAIAQARQQQQGGTNTRPAIWSPEPVSPAQLVPLGWHQGVDAAVTDGVLGGVGGASAGVVQEASSSSPEAMSTIAKQQAAVATELLARCRLRPWGLG